MHTGDVKSKQSTPVCQRTREIAWVCDKGGAALPQVFKQRANRISFATSLQILIQTGLARAAIAMKESSKR